MTSEEQHYQTVESFEQFPDNSYAEAALAGLAAFTIKKLVDLHIPTTFENIVVALFRMFPKKFSLIGFRHYPDAACVGRTLLQLGPKYRNWARGSVQKGFVLTESGTAKATEVAVKLISGETPSSGGRPKAQMRPRTMDPTKDIKAIEESSLYLRWKSGTLESSKSIELFDLLGAYAYTPSKVLHGRMVDLERIADETGRDDIVEFLRHVRRQFGEHLRS